MEENNKLYSISYQLHNGMIFDKLLIYTELVDFIKSEKYLSIQIDSVINDSNFVYSNINKIAINKLNKTVIKDNKIIVLSLAEYNVLLYFLENKTTHISYDQLRNYVSKAGCRFINKKDYPFDRIVTNLEAKINTKSIKHLPNGYRWIE